MRTNECTRLYYLQKLRTRLDLAWILHRIKGRTSSHRARNEAQNDLVPRGHQVLMLEAFAFLMTHTKLRLNTVR